MHRGVAALRGGSAGSCCRHAARRHAFTSSSTTSSSNRIGAAAPRRLRGSGGAAGSAAAAAAAAAARGRRRGGVLVRAMFTGIVQGTAEVAAVDSADNFKSFRIRFPPGRADGVSLGASVAIAGTCLTVTAIAGDVLSFDVMQETLRATSLGALQVGSRVNFERSTRVGDEIGGHTVSGHVHATAAVAAVEASPNNVRMVFELPARDAGRWMRYVLPKGFVAVDGCSLTVGEVEPGAGRFSVYLIPETLRVTTFGRRAVGDAVNIEVEAQTQAIVDTVERLLPGLVAAQLAAQQQAAVG